MTSLTQTSQESIDIWQRECVMPCDIIKSSIVDTEVERPIPLLTNRTGLAHSESISLITL